MRSAALSCLAVLLGLSCGDSGRRPTRTSPTNNNRANNNSSNNNTSNNNSSGVPVQGQVRSFRA